MINLNPLRLFNENTGPYWLILAGMAVLSPLAYMNERSMVNNACKEANYCCPENVISFGRQDVNADGEKDLVLKLRDGSYLKFIKNSGYSLQ